MRRTIVLFTLLFFGFSFSQENTRKIIDSINSNRWNSTLPDLDSLANPQIIKIVSKYKDTIVPKNTEIQPINYEIPLTPYRLNNYKEPQKWYFSGQNSLVFSQASFSNWNSGGNNNISVLGKINYNLSYRNRKHYLENIVQLGYGLLAAQGQSNRKTEDFINFMTNYGYDLGRNYYLSTGFKFVTQFMPGYNYNNTPDPEINDRISKFMAPGYLNVGLGVSYNPNENFQVILRPVNGKFTFVTDPLLQKAGKYGLERDGQNLFTELGALLNIIYRQKIYKNINLDNQLNFFSNYVFRPERMDVAYNGTLNIRFNKFITTVVSLDLVYDHDQIQKLQTKQTLGVGLSYSLGEQNKEKDTRKKVIKPYIVK